MAARDQPKIGPEDEGFLGRWSRRKAEAKTAEETAAVDPEILPDSETAEGVPAQREGGDPPAVDLTTLPDIDSLGPGSDFSLFMQAGVPPELRTRALRKLWRVKPELAGLDGLIDYGEDLTGSFKVVDQLKTAYQVGRGFLKDQADRATEEGGHAGDDEAAAASAEPAGSEDQRKIARDAITSDSLPDADDPPEKS